jgi:hypothetical protein
MTARRRRSFHDDEMIRLAIEAEADLALYRAALVRIAEGDPDPRSIAMKALLHPKTPLAY